MKKRILTITGLAVAAGLIWGALYVNSLLPIITGYPAKYLCSAVFISNRNPADVEATDLHFSVVRFVANHVDYTEKSVTSRFLWGESKAIYRDGPGCTLISSTGGDELRNKPYHFLRKASSNQDSIEWPHGNIMPGAGTGIDKQKLEEIAGRLMAGNVYHGKAFAFIVVHRDTVAAERYGPGFNAGTRFPGWSVAKSFINALVGILVKDGLIDIHQQAGIDEWARDDRKRITANDLLQMQSGLKWNEEYGNRSDVTTMLYDSPDFAGYAMNKPMEYPAGTHWNYSSGSTNILSYLIRKRFRDDSSYYSFAPTRLFTRTGMPDAVFETDPAGTLVGSSYIYATARDYARFGMLYLHDGVFCGERILPEGWVKYTTTPASRSNGSYGAGFWLNRNKYYPAAPEDMYSCNGHDGQQIFIIPSRDLVVVVLGYSPKGVNEMNFNRLLQDILGTITQ